MKTDKLIHAQLMNGEVRVMLCDTTQVAENARATHHASPPCAAALGRLCTCAVIMGCMLKSENDNITISLRGDGVGGALVAVSRPGGSVKAYAENPEADLPPIRPGKLDVGGFVGHKGRLSVVKDMGLKEPYVGQVDLVSGEVGEDVAYYFTVSEQKPTLLSVGVLVASAHDDDAHINKPLIEGESVVIASGGLLIQPLPGCSEGLLSELEKRAPKFENISKQIGECDSLEGLLKELLGDFGPEILESVTPSWRCDCSRERLERVMLSLGEKELNDMIKEQNGAEVTCHFCRTNYKFTANELNDILEAGKQNHCAVASDE